MKLLPAPPIDALGMPSVLVGRVRNAFQLEASLVHRFYHIPERQLHGHLRPTSHVALYIPKISPQEDEGVRYIGRVKAVRLVYRFEIDAIPKDSPQRYYLFTVEDWQPLKSPVVYRQNRAAPYFYTSRFLLANSDSTAELLVRSENDFLLFTQLQRLVASASVSPNRGFYCGRRFLHCDGDWIYIDDGVQTVCHRVSEFLRVPYDSFMKIRRILMQP